MVTPVLKFLRFSSGKTAVQDLDILDKAAQYAQSNQIDVEIIKHPEDIKSLLAKNGGDKQSIYICFPFEGKIFESLKQNGYRIIGPQCVISCLLLEIPVPKQVYPVCSVAMHGVMVCCSSMKKEERTQLHELVHFMGGEVTLGFTTSVTHLVAKEVGSKKYQVACTYKIPVLTPEWIKFCWEKSKYDHIVAKDDNIMKDFRLPVLQGCAICVTGINQTERERIKSLVQENGGTYSGELNMKICTHLLVESPSGQKYKHAMQWKLHCVKPAWLFDCLQKGHWVEEAAYIVEADTDTTMNQTNTKTEIQNTFRESILSTDISTSRLSTSKVAEIASKVAEISKYRSSKDEMQFGSKSVKYKNFDSSAIQLEEFVPPGNVNYYLDSCHIYLCSKPGPVFDHCRKIINCGGGIRLNALSESVTHIVLWDDIPTEVQKYVSEMDGQLPHVISPLWLIDSFKSSELQCESDYSLLLDYEQPTAIIKNDEVFLKPAPQEVKPKTASSLHAHLEDDAAADETTILNQYLCTNHESTRLSQINADRKSSSDKDLTLQNEETTSMMNEAPEILKGKSFSIQRFDTEKENRIKELILQFGGSYTSDVSSCDHIIVPLTYNGKTVVNQKEVTMCWLEQTIEQEELKKPGSSLLYQPIRIDQTLKPLKNCVITISQYMGMERDHLFHLTELLGGSGQEYFVRYDNDTMKASTHLVLMKPEGSKYNASIKWKIPCVSKQWLFKCAQTGKRAPETDFPVTENKTNIEDEIPVEESTSKHLLPHVLVDDGVSAVNFELSNRGASMIDVMTARDNLKLDKKDNGEAVSIKEEIKSNTVEQHNNNDFSEFNLMIAKEKTDVSKQENDELGMMNDANLTEIDKEHVNTPISFPIKKPLELNKSRYSFDFTEALDSMQSPASLSQNYARRKSRKSRGSLPFDVQFAEAIQGAIDKHVPESERISWSCPETLQKSGILKDVIVVISKKLAHRQTELHGLVNLLGGKTKFMYDPSCTHFVHQARLNDTSKDYMEVKKAKISLVSPFWLEACIEENYKADESKYPITYNPRMSLNVNSTRTTRSKINKKSKEDELEENVSSSGLQPKQYELSPEKFQLDQVDDECDVAVTACTNEDKLDFQKKMTEIMEATKAPRMRRSRRQTNSSLSKSDSTSSLTSVRKLRSRTSSQKSTDSSNSDPQTSKTGMDHLNEQSQGDYITYDDPTGRRERERILAQLKRASPSQDIESLHYPIDKFVQPERIPEVVHNQKANVVVGDGDQAQYSSINVNDLSSEPVKKDYNFLLSGMTSQEKIDYGAIIERLGGTVFDVQYFHVECTHIIFNAPTRNEKYLAAVASGKWALHKSYLEASREKGEFVNEADHEWGCQPGTSYFASAAKRWRIELVEERKHNPNFTTFSNWVVLLCIEPAKQPGFKRILETGGASVLSVRPPYNDVKGVTHLFVGDKNQAINANVDFESLHKTGMLILKPEYISDYLTVFPKPSAKHYLLDGVKHLNETSAAVSGKRKANEEQPPKSKRTRR